RRHTRFSRDWSSDVCSSDLLAFCTERLAEGRAIADSRSIPVAVGGVDRASADIAAYFWEKVLGVATIRTAGSVAAELVKLVDNLWIDLNVALANEGALLAEMLGVDGLEVFEAADAIAQGQGMAVYHERSTE